jgi:hypothetical protein
MPFEIHGCAKARTIASAHVGQKDRQQRFQRGDVRIVRHFQLQHHDGDDDRQNAVTERLDPASIHASIISGE